ncbi:Sulfhydryl oxidase 2 [Portunus trituberculatus]|uniref:Sulfhydryl oxidase 2 n=1 Tax=Portunus trituberculatus TaxID=210409 RepID=A0A5B7EQD3_PORTR|nr:Sulfhydryl oxidase 2 [Portunus trituberculatus]
MGSGGAGIVLLFLCFISSLTSIVASLYNSTDDVVILDHTNFTATVHGTENAWVVEFYSSWCGHCIQFAPTWKLFGRDVRDWEHTIKVGVLDCSVDENVPICREHEIMGYPTVKLFAARTTKGDIGSAMPHLTTVEELGEAVTDFLVEKQKTNSGSKSWADLQPYKGAVETLLESGSGAEWAVLVIDKAKSHTAWALLMDLAGYPSIVARYKEADQEDVRRFGTAGLPAVMIVSKDGKEETLNDVGKSRDEMRTAILKKLMLNREMLGKKTSSKEDREGAGDGQPEEINKDKLNYGDDLPDTAFTSMERNDQVFMVDIENAVSYAINHEVAQHKVIKAMYAEDAESSIKVADDTILWLWRGHNKVNKRLKGDASEDPRHPKQQFPSPAACPSCWHGENFSEREVLTYLKTIYAKGALSFRGTQTIPVPPRNRQEKVQQQLHGHRQQSQVLISHQDNKLSRDQSPQNTGSWSFTNTDISLCVLLYGASTIIIMAVYCSVVIRRKMRRRKFLEAYKLP